MPPRQSAPPAASPSTSPSSPPPSLGSAFAEANLRQAQAQAEDGDTEATASSTLSKFVSCGKRDDKGRLQCPGATLGRACKLCGSTGWKKRCPDCLGSRTVYKSPRVSGGQIKADPCARCLGRGFTPPTRPELDEAVAEAKVLAAAESQSELASV